jgi:hypothetical protein
MSSKSELRLLRVAMVPHEPTGDGLLFSTGKSPIQALAFSLTSLSDNL